MPPERYPLQNAKAAWRVYDGEAVIVSPEDSMLHTLNPVGTLIWEASDGRTTMNAIVTRVCATFAVDEATAARDTTTFVDALCRRGLLSVADRPAA